MVWGRGYSPGTHPFPRDFALARWWRIDGAQRPSRASILSSCTPETHERKSYLGCADASRSSSQLLLLTRALYVDDPAGILDALGWWALWAFCSHVFFARTIESPWGFVIEVLLMPVFVVGFRHYDRWLGREPREIPVGRGVAAETSSAAAKASPLVSEHPYGTFGESKDP